MAVPKYNEFFPSFLTFLGDGQEHDLKEIRAYCADSFQLSDEDRNAVIPSGRNMLIDRVGWAKTHLKKAGLIDSPSRAKFCITALGKEALDKGTELSLEYSVILRQWMEGSGLFMIMKSAVEWRENHPQNFWISKYQKTTYDYSLTHKNIVLSSTLEVIDNVILFSISNYFLKFSNEYMRIHDITEFNNNWYEYVEYGTTNPVTIQLQRHGFSREAATYIKDNHEDWIIRQEDGTIKLKRDALTCTNENTKVEANQVVFNSPDLFEQEAKQ